MTMIKTQFLFLSSFKNFTCEVRACYGYLRENIR